MPTKPRPSGGTPATRILAAAGVGFSLHPYHHDPDRTHYGEEAVAALGADPRRVFKTLVVSVVASGPATGPGTGRLAVAVLPVASRLDPKAMGAAVGAKRVELADPVVAGRTTGYVVGGISPLGQRTALPTVVDSSAQGHETIMVSAGRRGLQLELRPGDLVAVLGARLAPISS